MHLKTFISYSHEDRKIAWSLKEGLRSFGIISFLAHEDIEIGDIWRNRIISELKNNDIFIALISKNFKSSEWTGHETGYAISKEKPIIPLIIDDVELYGFLEMYQAKTQLIDEDIIKRIGYDSSFVWNQIITSIIKDLKRFSHFHEKLVDSLIIGMDQIYSYANAEAYFDVLKIFYPFTEEQINNIIINSINNNQIYNANGCQSILKEWLIEFKDHIKDEYYHNISELIEL